MFTDVGGDGLEFLIGDFRIAERRHHLETVADHVLYVFGRQVMPLQQHRLVCAQAPRQALD